MFFSDATRRLKIKLDGTVATSQLPLGGGWAEIVKSTGAWVSADMIHTVTNNATGVVLCDLASSGNIRKLEGLSVVNEDTATRTVTIYQDDGSNPRDVFSVQLAQNSQLVIDDAGRPTITRADGTNPSGGGSVTSVSVVTSNGISGSVATATSTPAITLALASPTVWDYLQPQSTDIASATTTDLSTATGPFVKITGTTTITGFGTVSAGTSRILRFAGVLTLTYNATSLILPTAANLVTAANDVAEFVSLGSGNWICSNYQRANGQALSGSALATASTYVSNGRLTLTSGTPVTTSDVTAATTLYFTPGAPPQYGDYVGLYDGTNWHAYQFTELSIKATDSAQTGSWSTGAKTITGLTSTAQLCRGMQVTGTNIAANSVIASIDSATQVTLNNTPSGTGSAAAVTFKLVPSTVYDVFLVYNGGSPRLQFDAWTSATARADAISQQNGVYLNTSAINNTDSNTIAAKTGRLVGTISTTATAGQTEDSLSSRLVWNADNRLLRPFRAFETTDSWTGPSNVWREANSGSTLGTSRCGVVLGLSLEPVSARTIVTCNSSGTNMATGVGISSSTVQSAMPYGIAGSSSLPESIQSAYCGWPGIGFYTVRWLEFSTAGGTFYGDGGLTYIQSGMSGEVMA